MHHLIPAHYIVYAVESVSAEGGKEYENIKISLTSERESAYNFLWYKDKSDKSYSEGGKNVKGDLQQC